MIYSYVIYVIFMLIDALCVLCAQLTRDLLAIAKFLSYNTGMLRTDGENGRTEFGFLYQYRALV